ncbi:helicase [Sulfuricaulis limicola]|uniref:Helicase n=1 Tax=Sulfuricaulis limicola TaxID=1620215 RepID=A0A1B4XF15_9GAMM|nr:helicase-related protein [Sulfuricaulis limicola]BAV33389.1 helicase [Sulfuricaulis limicola]
MNDLIRIATVELARFLSTKLPTLSPDWWQKSVVGRLSFQQQRMVQERGYATLQQLDFAALLRVLDQNWYELSNVIRVPREGRTWVKELQTVRNKWAHLSAEAMPASEAYRDADTLGRLLAMIGSDPASINAVESAKTAAVTAMAGRGGPSSQGMSLDSNAAVLGTAETKPNEPEARVTAAPASLFKMGDLVALRSNPATVMPVIEVLPGGAECRYRVFHNNAKATYYERQLQAPAVAVDERRILTAHELHARLTSLQILSPSSANLFSLRSGRVQFVPYQYRPVLKLIRADRPRLLIADEVGVGKTIEAGLIIKELRARTDISSVLIICPKALVAERKWLVEMKRFDEHFTALDGPLLRHCLHETNLEGEWPEQYAKAILPFSLFDSDLLFGRSGRGGRKDEGLLSLDPPPKFDLVIVDEAHHIRNAETFLHQGVRYFCDNAQAVLLLTATPVQLGSDDLYTLLNVLRPDLIIDHASFEQMAEPNRSINMAIQHCRAAQKGWQREARTCLDEVAQTEWGRLFIRESPAFQSIHDRLQEDGLGDTDRVGLTRAIEELYTFSPLINRTRRRDIGEFTTRKPETVTVEFTGEQKRLHDGLLDVVARILAFCHGQQNVKFMMTTIRRQAASCLYGLAPLLQDMLTGKLDRLELMEASDGDEDIDLGFIDQVRADINALLEQARNLDPYDPKVAAFTKVLLDKNKLTNNKVLVFSTFRHTLAYLAAHTQRTGLRYGLIHGDVPDEERTNLRRRFALPREDADGLDVLLSSEVGCEGLDFQFCDLLINYDLPWNPMRIEQRIGRIDRYGQKSETVAIVNFVTPGTVDADIYERCLWRIGVFQHAVGGSEEILGEITQELHDIAESFNLTPDERERRLTQLADNGIRQIREEQELESKQAELFGLNIPGQYWRQEIEAAETYWLSSAAMHRCVSTYLSLRLGSDIEQLLGEKPLKTLRLSQDARNKLLDDYRRLPRSIELIARDWEKWLKGAQPTMAVTFDQTTAAENPKAAHLSVVHPLVRQAAHYLELDEPTYVSLSVEDADLPPGEHRFALYRWTKHGVKPDEALVAVAADPAVEAALLKILQSATETGNAALPEAVECDALDVRHHGKWTEAQANHIAENQQLVEQRIQSLTVSHGARCKAIEDQIARATNDKIRLMKESELVRANADFARRLEQIHKAANSADILAAPVVFGTIAIMSGEAK